MQGVRIRINLASEADSFDNDGIINDFNDDDVSAESFATYFEEIGLKLEDEEIEKWLTTDDNDSGIQLYTDDEICEFVSHPNTEAQQEDEDTEDEDTEDEQPACLVRHSEAAQMFEKCLGWLENQPEATVYNKTLLRELQELAIKKRMECIVQSKITKYFK